MTRESDISLPKTERINKVRQISPNDPNILLISNHINSGGGEGAEVVYGLRNNSTLSDMVLNNIGEAGQIKRKTYQRRLPENPNKDYYYIIRDTAPRESILIEYGFIDNARDLRKLQNDLDKYAEGVVKAVADYVGVNYILPGSGSDDNVVSRYTVVFGDTLYSIASRYGISVKELKRLNNLVSDTLSIGQELIIPNKNIDNNDIKDGIYTVQRGDTLYGIATRYNTTVDEIKRVNNIIGNNLFIGQQLIIPSTNDISNEEYIVQQGDSLYAIAKKYNISVNDLINYNNLGNLTIYVGDKLLIPNSSLESITYIVKKGDSLYSIARRYNVSVDDIINSNGLISPNIFPNQELIIPRK